MAVNSFWPRGVQGERKSVGPITNWAGQYMGHKSDSW